MFFPLLSVPVEAIPAPVDLVNWPSIGGAHICVWNGEVGGHFISEDINFVSFDRSCIGRPPVDLV